MQPHHGDGRGGREMRVTPLLTVTALAEGPTGLLLLVWPALVLALLFGWRHATAETLVVARVAGAGVLSIGVTSWTARRDASTPAARGVLTGLVVYNVVAAAVLVLAAVGLEMVGILLWPAVVYHAALATWSIACSRGTKATARV